MLSNFICQQKERLTDLRSLVMQALDRGADRPQLRVPGDRHRHPEMRRHDVAAVSQQHQQMTRQYAGDDCCLHLSASQTSENTADQHLHCNSNNNDNNNTY